VLAAAQGALAGFSRRFGAYPYPTLTVVSLPLEVFGCEFSGIVLVSSRLAGPAAEVGGIPPLVLAEATTAHEVAHQWFFGLVGSDQVLEPWLDESLAQYATLLFYRDRDGEPGARGYRQSFEGRWERVGRADIPIGKPVAAYTEKEYAAIVYGRAPLFLEALADRMGRPAFDRLLRAWCARFRWKIARGRDFLSLAGEECGCDLGGLAAEWGALP
jgi:aminopeptidase N